MSSYLKTVCTHKCPRCHEGKMFTHSWQNFKHISSMPEKCSVCGQRTEIEIGFYQGAGYVSYALTVAFSVASFIAWWVLIGFSLTGNSIFWWLGCNSLALVLLLPWFLRTSRVIWLSWFYHKDDEQFNTINTQTNTSAI